MLEVLGLVLGVGSVGELAPDLVLFVGLFHVGVDVMVYLAHQGGLKKLDDHSSLTSLRPDSECDDVVGLVLAGVLLDISGDLYWLLGI